MKNEEELQPTTVTVDYAEAFQSIQGCAVILNSENNTYTFYNEDKCRTRVSPNSTFKVISALIGIHNQVVTSEDSKMEYDGMNYPVDAWNADLRLEDAFRSSCIWYFRKVIEEVGQETIQEELNKLDYGNCDISEWSGSGVNSFPELNVFWIESSLLISPIEQVEVLHKIMEGETIYAESEIEILKSIMLLEASDSKKIYGKTGTGTNGTAWFIGFVEKENTNILDITPEQLLTGKGIDPEYKDTDMDYEVTRSDIKILKQIHSLGDEQYKRLMAYMKALQKLEQMENMVEE